MAMNLRPEVRHEEILERLMEKLELKTKSKAIFWLIENFERIEADNLENYKNAARWREKYYELLSAAEAQLIAERKAADLRANLSRLCRQGRPGSIDETFKEVTKCLQKLT